jgi:hypothetical protein
MPINRKNKFVYIVLFFCSAIFVNIKCLAQWNNNVSINNSICNSIDSQVLPKIVSDSSGGAIIAWTDNRSGTNDIYAQRINAAGYIQWDIDGVLVTGSVDVQNEPNIVSDGSGGAIITWQDKRNGINNDIYAQHINGAGVVQWSNDGVAICTALNNQHSPEITSDDNGGAIITWQDLRNGVSNDIYAQHINGGGLFQWTSNGIPICIAPGLQNHARIISDESGGAIITWFDFRSGLNDDIYAQRISNSGLIQWTNDGVAICSAANYQVNPILISNGSGGAIIAWEDHRLGTEADIYAQLINSSGQVQWLNDGVVICTSPSDQYSPTIVSDNTGGAIITWYDYRNGTNDDIYSQRINAAGLVQWTNNGVAICTALNDQYYPVTVSDGNSGAIITWQDYRLGSFSDVYAQLINSFGQIQWITNGVVVSDALNNQVSPIIVSNNTGGAIVAWQDGRTGTFDDIFAQQISSEGNVNAGIKGVTNNRSVTVYPNPSNGEFTIETTTEEKQTMQLFDINGKIIYSQKIDTKTNIVVPDLKNGIYYLSITIGENVINKKLAIIY